MLTIDTIPLNIKGKLITENGKLFLKFPIIHCQLSITTCFLCAAGGSGSDDRIC